MKICPVVFKLWSGHEIVNTQRAITPKAGKPELQFLCSAHRLMVFNVCVKFHDNMSSGFKVMEQTRKLLTDTHTEKKQKHYTPMACFVCQGYNEIIERVVPPNSSSIQPIKGWLKKYLQTVQNFNLD